MMVPRYSRRSSGSTRTVCGHVSHLDEADPLEPLRGRLGRLEVPRPGPAGERGLGDRVDRGPHGGDVALAAALRDEPAAGLERGEQVLEEAVVVGDPVEGRGREDRVDGRLEHELGEVGDADVDARPEPLARLGDHRGRAVDRDHLAARQPLQQRRRHAARAAAGVEHALVAAQLEAVEHLAAHRLQRRRDALVGLGVPVARASTRHQLLGGVGGLRHQRRDLVARLLPPARARARRRSPGRSSRAARRRRARGGSRASRARGAAT